ncbi:MAG: GHKL domain-containing protein [Bacteriovoracaceae bacterium]|nr:GHKL domain-containing protein [Bacteriovoracaceae bacterium]
MIIKRISHILISLLFVVTSIYAYSYWDRKKTQNRLEVYAHFFSVPLWNLNKEGIENYLVLLTKLHEFFEIKVLDENNDKFLSYMAKEEESHGHIILKAISVVKKEYFVTNIFYEGEIIGEIQAYRFVDRSIVIFYLSLIVFSVWIFLLIIRRYKSEQKILQQQIFQAGKLASLGTIAAGIAHELNNPLSIISGYTEVISRAREFDLDKDSINEHCRGIREAISRMKMIINHVRIFSRDSIKHPFTSCSINKVINDSMILISKQIQNRDIDIKLELSENVPETKMNPNKIESVIQNLIINARDAFEDVKDDRDKFIRISSSYNIESKEIIVKITDNATGISTDQTSRIFDPFYTTKDVGKGTGLGLSISHGIIEEHNGFLDVESMQGEGTTFTIVLHKI